jgi:hypothetical protein
MRTIAAIVLLLAAVSMSAASRQDQFPQRTPDENRAVVYRTSDARVAIARSIHVPADEEVNSTIVVIFGSLQLDGRARDGAVVVGGDLRLGPTADVRGDVVVVGGELIRAPEAIVRGRVSEVALGDWGGWTFGGIALPRVDFGGLERWLVFFGTLFRLAFLVLTMAIVLLVARAPVARVGRAAGAEPVKAFAVGLIAEVMFLPVLVMACLALIMSIVGIPLVAVLVPAALVAAFVALVLGFTGVACRIGEWLEDRLGLRVHNAFVAAIGGLILIALPTLIARLLALAPDVLTPLHWALLSLGLLLEFVIWTIGLGAALMTGYGRWSTTPPPVPPPAPSGALAPAS